MSKSSTSNLAVLSTVTESVAVLSYEIKQDSSGWVQLLPAGKFKAVDDRPYDTPDGHWHIDADIAQQLISLANARVNDLVVDYEHQTLQAKDNGQPAPAAGWFKEMEWREDSGLWIKPKWTTRASGYIKNGEYQFLSAVFPYDKATGKPLYLHSAALTNRACIDGMQKLEALAAQHIQPSTNHQEHSMNELLKQMLTQLGIEVEDGKDLSEAQSTAALTALTNLQTKAGTAEALATEVAALKANDNGGTPDPAQWAPVAALNELHAKLAVLSAQTNAGELDQVIDKAKREGRITPTTEDWARRLGTKDMAALNEYLDKALPIVALNQMQTTTVEVPSDQGRDPVAALSEEQKTAADLLGMTHKEYANHIANEEGAK